VRMLVLMGVSVPVPAAVITVAARFGSARAGEQSAAQKCGEQLVVEGCLHDLPRSCCRVAGHGPGVCMLGAAAHAGAVRM
ncbi:hypothetical protein EG864_15510, partial [Enterococcus faecalis]